MATETEHVSTCGKYRAGDNQVAFTKAGDVEVSTIWWKRSPAGAVDWFETLVFQDNVAQSKVPVTYSSEKEALVGHAEIAATVLATIAVTIPTTN